jgi:hypothetical protein
LTQALVDLVESVEDQRHPPGLHQTNRAAAYWAESPSLRRFWFPFNTRAARVDAVVHAPAAFRRRGVYLAAQELGVA